MNEWCFHLSLKMKGLLDYCLTVLLSLLGGALLTVGLYRLGHSVLHSAAFHALMGLLLLLMYSETARLWLLRLLPRSLLVYLYRKSVLDVLIEPSPMTKAYMVVALSSVLGDDELQRLSNTLPRECDYMRRPGLIHLLPEVLQRMLHSATLQSDLELEQAEEVLAQENSLVGEVAEPDDGDFFVAPRFLGTRDGQLAAGADYGEDGYADDEGEGENGAAAMPVATHIVAASASRHSTPHLRAPTEFEQVFSEISAARARALARQASQALTQQGAALSWAFVSGGGATDSQLALACLFGGSAAALSGLGMARLAQGHGHGHGLLKILRPVILAGGDALVRAGAGLSALTAAMLAVRGAASLTRGTRDSGEATVRQRRFFFALSRAYGRAHDRCLQIFRHNPLLATATALSLALAAFLAWSLRDRWRRTRWLLAVLLDKMRERLIS